jgi:hypothetical protein
VREREGVGRGDGAEADAGAQALHAGQVRSGGAEGAVRGGLGVGVALVKTRFSLVTPASQCVSGE